MNQQETNPTFNGKSRERNKKGEALFLDYGGVFVD